MRVLLVACASEETLAGDDARILKKLEESLLSGCLQLTAPTPDDDDG